MKHYNEKNYLLSKTLIGKIRLYITLSIRLCVLFIVFYGGANWINKLRDNHFHLYYHWELDIPFIPWMILVYLSLQLLFLVPIFHCIRSELIILAKRMGLAICVAGIIFVLIPSVSGFQRVDNPAYYSELFSMLYMLDKPYNLFPSLHIILSTLVVVTVTRDAGLFRQVFYFSWLLLMFISALVIHQHHINDILGGLALTYICMKAIPQRESLVGARVQ